MIEYGYSRHVGILNDFDKFLTIYRYFNFKNYVFDLFDIVLNFYTKT